MILQFLQKLCHYATDRPYVGGRAIVFLDKNYLRWSIPSGDNVVRKAPLMMYPSLLMMLVQHILNLGLRLLLSHVGQAFCLPVLINFKQLVFDVRLDIERI